MPQQHWAEHWLRAFSFSSFDLCRLPSVNVFVEVAFYIRGDDGDVLERKKRAYLFLFKCRLTLSVAETAQLHLKVNLMHDEGWLLINVFSTDGRGFFWNKCNLVRSLVQFFKILWESLSIFLRFEIQSFLLLRCCATCIVFFREDLGCCEWVPWPDGWLC